MSATTHLLYLHGFRSGPGSFKARRLLGWLAAHQPEVQTWCPQLPASPREAMAMVLDGVAGWPAASTASTPSNPSTPSTPSTPSAAVVGSSLGGFYALQVAQRLGWRAVVLNPAVDPARDLARHIGEQSAWHDPDRRFFFRPEYVDELRALAAPPAPLRSQSQSPTQPQPQRLLAVIATGDELLDWREMAARCAGGTLRVVPGSDHALSDFDRHLPSVLQFLGLGAAAV